MTSIWARAEFPIHGPGFALVEAGRDVFLGKGGGIQTVGNGEKPGTSGIEAAHLSQSLFAQKGRGSRRPGRDRRRAAL